MLRSHRHQHYRAGRYTFQRLALDMHEWRNDLPRYQTIQMAWRRCRGCVVVHVSKGAVAAPYLLNGKALTASRRFSFMPVVTTDPEPMEENADKSFIGSYVLGMGFTFDDTDKLGSRHLWPRCSA